jgi:hypothetical protein
MLLTTGSLMFVAGVLACVFVVLCVDTFTRFFRHAR